MAPWRIVHWLSYQEEPVNEVYIEEIMSSWMIHHNKDPVS